MQTALRVLRYFVFVFFVICNAIVASVGVWNNSLSDAVRWSAQTSIYLIFLGCFGLSFIFAVVFVELAHRHAITGRVWFECLWVGLFWLLYLGGAAAVTAVLLGSPCGLPRLDPTLQDACISAEVLVGFTWGMTVILLSYFCFLVILSLLHMEYDPEIWHRYVHKFPWNKRRRVLTSAPTSPHRPSDRVKSIVAPRPKRAIPNAVYASRLSLGSDDGVAVPPPPPTRTVNPIRIEQRMQPPPRAHLDRPQPPLQQPTYSAPEAASRSPRLSIPVQPSFYAQHIQSTLEPVRSTYGHRPRLPPTPPSPTPPPLGDWPRQNPETLWVSPSKRHRMRVPPVTGQSLPRDEPSSVRRLGPINPEHRTRPLGPRNLDHPG